MANSYTMIKRSVDAYAFELSATILTDRLNARLAELQGRSSHLLDLMRELVTTAQSRPARRSNKTMNRND